MTRLVVIMVMNCTRGAFAFVELSFFLVGLFSELDASASKVHVAEKEVQCRF